MGAASKMARVDSETAWNNKGPWIAEGEAERSKNTGKRAFIFSDHFPQCSIIKNSHACFSFPFKGVPQLPCAKALYNYEGKEPGDLNFSKGDIIILRRQVDENWYHGEVNGIHGFFPTNFVQIIKPLPQPPPQCIALYDFEVRDKEADKDCLPFAKDDVLMVIRRVDENWAEGMLSDKIGIFPISYVEEGEEKLSRCAFSPSLKSCTAGLCARLSQVHGISYCWQVFLSPHHTTPFGHAGGRRVELLRMKLKHVLGFHIFFLGAGEGEKIFKKELNSDSWKNSGPGNRTPSELRDKKSGEPPGDMQICIQQAPLSGTGFAERAMAPSPPEATVLPSHGGSVEEDLFISREEAQSPPPASGYQLVMCNLSGIDQVHISTTGLIVTPPPSSPVTTGPSFTFPSDVPYQAALGVHISTTGLIVTPPPSSPVTTGPSFTFPSDVPYQAALGNMNPPLPPPPLLAATVNASTSPAAASSGVGQRPAGSADQIAHLRPQTRPSVYVAIYPYTPRKEDELELRKGEMFLVFERCQDGWFKGTSMHTSKIGVFPGNYVAPVTRTVTSVSQSKVSMSTSGQTGRVVTMVSPSTTAGPSQKLQGNGVAGSPGVGPAAVASAGHIQTSPQAKVLMAMTGQMTVNQARNAVRTVAVHNQERPTAAVMPIQVQNSACLGPAAMILPHQQPQPSIPTSAAYVAAAVNLNRPTMPMACVATASLNSPGVPGTSLETELSGRAGTALPGPPTSPESVVSAGGNSLATKSDNVSKRRTASSHLVFASTDPRMQKHVAWLDWWYVTLPRNLLGLCMAQVQIRAPFSVSLFVARCIVRMRPDGDGETVEDPCSCTYTAGCRSAKNKATTTPKPFLSQESSFWLRPVLCFSSPLRSRPESKIGAALGRACRTVSKAAPGSHVLMKTSSLSYRHRVVVSYPPQSEAELELREGDIVFVHKKREDGWFKGTLQHNGKTGLFPGSFVENI
ncbi:E3 ubiquitin-protein ligase SH3RF1 [Gracilinanus agilis]|uniref:E3 ubiquitin-protein ligase SH3RF1 n=1 Tax=Gracilinanus agilis TaxID=191870 RepID=UPI001CFC80E4|nr:E3 ubiquitin-protein ligase SH3RF1 [Gracilinanus agilis]